MSWTDRVQCVPCERFSHWVVVAGVWTCRFCGTPMHIGSIKAMHYLQDCERWLAAEKEWKGSSPRE